jgi:hypothetical protein
MVHHAHHRRKQMIHNTTRKVLLPALGAALLGVTLAGCGNNATDDTAATTPETTTTVPDTSTQDAPPATGEAASAASFTDAAATWEKVTAANAALDKIIKENKLSEVHEAAFKVRDIVKTLPAQSQALSADKQKTLASQVKNVEQIAAMLDEAGDAGKMKETQENQAAMNDALDIIKGLYPAGALK